MKKSLLIVAAAMLITFAANAQEKFTYGIKGGFNGTTVTNCEYGMRVTKYTHAFNVGVFAEWRLTRLFAIAPELIYSRQGADATQIIQVSFPSYFMPGYTYKVQSDLKLGYLNIPVMAKIYTTEWFSIDFGPQAGVLLSAKAKTTMPDNTPYLQFESKTVTTDSKHEIRTFDFSLAVGFTCDIGKNLFLQGRYTIGMTEVFKDKNERYYYLNDLPDKTSRNQVYTLGLGYRF